MRRPLVALAILLAGCSGGVPTPGEPTPTLTAVSVPGDRAVALVSHDSIAPAAALVAAHERELDRRPTTRTAYAGMYTPGPYYDYVLTIARNGSRYGGTLQSDAEMRVNDTRVVERLTYKYYHAGDRVLVRVDEGETVSYRALPADTEPPFATVRLEQLRAVLGAADLQVANARTTDGNYRIYADSVTVDRLPTYRGDVTDATVSGLYATVTSDGYVVQHWFDYEGTLDGEPVRGWIRVRPSPDSAVESPDWYDSAVNATDSTPPTPTTG